MFKSKKAISLQVILFIVLGIGTTGLSVFADTTLNDDFESYQVDAALPVGGENTWSFVRPNVPGSSSKVIMDGSNKVLEIAIDTSQTGSSTYYYVQKNGFDLSAGKTIIKTKVKAPGTHASNDRCDFSFTTLDCVWRFMGGQILLSNGAWNYQQVQTYTPDHWYQVSLVIDPISKTYTLFVTDDTGATTSLQRSTGTNVDYSAATNANLLYTVYINPDTGTKKFTIDDVNVFSDPVLYDNFESYQVDTALPVGGENTWSYTRPNIPGSSSKVIMEGSNKVLEIAIDTSQTGSSTYYYVQKNGIDLSVGKTIIEARVKAPGAHATNDRCDLTFTALGCVWRFMGGQILLNNGAGNYQQVQTYTPDHWYYLSTVIDASDKTYTLFVTDDTGTTTSLQRSTGTNIDYSTASNLNFYYAVFVNPDTGIKKFIIDNAAVYKLPALSMVSSTPANNGQNISINTDIGITCSTDLTPDMLIRGDITVNGKTDDFESYQVDTALPVGGENTWSFVRPNVPGSSSKVMMDGSNKVLEIAIDTSQTSSSTYYYVQKNGFDLSTGKTIVKTKVKAPGTHASNDRCDLSFSTLSCVWRFMGGQILLNNGAANYQQVQTYTSGQWYELALEIDPVDKTYTLYVTDNTGTTTSLQRSTGTNINYSAATNDNLLYTVYVNPDTGTKKFTIDDVNVVCMQYDMTSDQKTFSIILDKPLVPETEYTVALSGLKDIFGQAMLDTSFSFTPHKVIDVADYGAVPDDEYDDTSAITSAVSALNQSGDNSILLLHPGKYYIENATYGIDIQNLENITVDGQGAELVVHATDPQTGSDIIPVNINGVNGVTVRNLTIYWDKPYFSQGEIVSTTSSSMTVLIDDNYPVTGNEPVKWLMDYDTVTRMPLGKFDLFETAISDVTLVDTQTLRIDFVTPHWGAEKNQYFTDVLTNMPTGTLIVLRHADYGPYDDSICAVNIFNSQDVNLENVNIYGAPGMGISAAVITNFTMDGVHIKPMPNTDRMMSTTVDGAHLMYMKGDINITNSEILAPGDDCINISSKYLVVNQLVDSTHVDFDVTYGWIGPLPQAGDIFEFYAKGTFECLGSRTVQSAYLDSNVYKVTFTQAIPGSTALQDLAFNTTYSPTVSISDSTFGANRGRGIYAGVRNAVIDNVTIHDTAYAGILLWTDSTITGPTSMDVTISNCTFENNSMAPITMFPYTTSPGKVDSNINITDCTFTEDARLRALKLKAIKSNYLCFTSGIYMTSVDTGEISGNTFNGYTESMYISNTDSIAVQDNEALDAQPEKLCQGTNTNYTQQNNTNMSIITNLSGYYTPYTGFQDLR